MTTNDADTPAEEEAAGGSAPADDVGLSRTQLLTDTMPADAATQRLPVRPPGEMSLEQYAWLYACEKTSATALDDALADAAISVDDYLAWKDYWNARMMVFGGERERWFALVAKLQS